jgi:hypothetical protein
MSAWDWLEGATFTNEPLPCLGEDHDGNLYVPARGCTDRWVPFTWRNPRHWLYYLRSRDALTVVVLEPVP